MLYAINSKYFSAGLIVDNGVVSDAAPIIKWMRGKSMDYVIEYCGKKGWKIEVVS